MLRHALRWRPLPAYTRRRRIAAAAAPGPDAVADLPRWVGAAGGDAARVAVRAAGASLGYSLLAATGVAPGEALVALPKGLLLADAPLADPAREAALLRLQAAVPEELWGGRLALRLLAHRAAGEASPFAPYIGALPAGVPGLPMFFSKAGIDALQEYPPLHAQVLKRCAWLATFARDRLASLTPGNDPFGGVSVDAGGLAWGLAAVTSRAFAVAGGARRSQRALLPLIDMANHSWAANAAVEAAAGGGVALRATRRLAAGEAVTLNYGNLPTSDFLLDYGVRGAEGGAPERARARATRHPFTPPLSPCQASSPCPTRTTPSLCAWTACWTRRRSWRPTRRTSRRPPRARRGGAPPRRPWGRRPRRACA